MSEPDKGGASWSSTRKWGAKRGAKAPAQAPATTAAAPPGEKPAVPDKAELRRRRFQAPPPPDRLQQYGLASRGDESQLQTSEAAQQEYFDWILDTFRKLDGESAESPASPASGGSMDHVLASLRKLREALMQRPPDAFARRVHLFSVRVSAAVGHYQTYVPCINHLLEQRGGGLSAAERRELVTLLVLHVSHCNGDNARAMRLFHDHLDAAQDRRLLDTVTAWVAGDYRRWMAIYHGESDHALYAIMSMGVDRMVAHTVACFSASFYTYSASDFAAYMPRAMTWAQFKEKYKVPWEVADGTVVVRRRAGSGK